MYPYMVDWEEQRVEGQILVPLHGELGGAEGWRVRHLYPYMVDWEEQRGWRVILAALHGGLGARRGPVHQNLIRLGPAEAA